MEADGERSVSVLKEFQIKSYLAPVTPMKPDIRQIYANGNTAVQPSVAYLEESEAYGFGLSQQWNLTQGSESCSTSNYAENSNFNSRAAAEEHRLDGYLPQWNHDEVQSMVSQMPPHHMNRFGQAYTRKHNRLDQDAMVPLQGPDDPLAHLSHFKFGDLLGMNQFGLAPPISGNPLGDGGSTSGSGSGSGSGSLIVDLNSPWEENMYTEGQGMLRGSNQYMSGNCAPEMQHCDIPCHVYGNFYDSNSLQSTKNSFPNGNRSIYAPATPDQSKLLSERTRLSTVQAAYQHYMEQENQVAATTRVDLQGIQNNEAEAPPGSDASPGKMSTLVENHDLDKGNSEGFDLNKSPQQKPRRKKHRPKVVREAKPKRAPKPSTPKPTNPTKNPQAKRKYVRKNKTNVPLTTPARSSELPNPDPRNPVVNSCRRSLNFDLDERVREDSTLHRSNYTSYSAPQANGASASENPLSHAIPFGKEKEAVVQMLNAGTAYDITYSVNQQLKEYIKLSQGETSNTSSLPKAIPSQVNGKVFAVDQNSRMENNQAVSYPMEGSSSKRLFKADSFVAQSTNASTSTSPVDGEHRQKRTFSASVDRLDEETRKLAANHGAFCSLNNLFYGDGKINIMANLLFPDICKKRRSEKVQRLNTSCGSSSATTLEDERDLAMNCDGAAGDTTASKYYFSPPAPNFATAHTDMAEAAGASYETRMQFVHNWTDIHKFKKKRSKVLTRARDLASLTGFAERTETDDTPGNQARKYTRKKADVTNSQIACLEALAADNHVPRMTKKRSRARFVKSNRSNVKEPKMQPDLLVNANQKRTEKAIGPLLALPWPDISVDDITDRLQKLDMNRESSNIVSSHENALVRYQANGQVEASFTQKQNALVLYQKAGTIVPFEGPFDPAKKRRQRAKVDLDEETTRVWKLLLENIDNAGINGTDEDKVKWWEEERRVFHGRVDSFIARMRLVQGDRRFSPWKGSVVDSVIGVFLTQNVSDHLSSSAFMSLAAHFPLKSRSKVKAKYEEGTGASPESSVLDLEGFEICGAKLSDEQVWDRNSRTLYDADHGEEKEVVNSRELLEGNLGLSPQDTHGSIIVNSCQSSQKLPQELVERHTNYIIDMETASTNGDARAMDDVTSSLHSVLSSLASTNSPSGLTAGRMGSSPENNSEVDDPITRANSGVFGYSTSYTELLKMAENPILQETCINRGSYSLSYQGSTNNEQQCREVEQQLWILEKDIHESTLKAPNISSNNRLHLRTDVQLQDANCARMVDEESRSSDNSATKDDNCTTEQSDLSNESAIQSPFQEKVAEKNQKPVSSAENICSSYVFDGERMVMKSQRQVTAAHEAPTQPAHEEGCLMPKAMDLPPGRTHESESNRTWDDRNTNSHNDMPVPRHNTKGSANKIGDVGMIKQTKGKAGKGKNTASDWDSLRKYAEMNDRKRERTSHTMDSLDYEAVRRADVGEIADTIKERGMNNMLAERMKDFLNRLVADHGSIDLEWLRDVPPDKAKEYLLSVRGLGLKSVECVRLLTLHHLAFPVDTNVGRIAVRLGWVPLQPLPESLQLHLLELYPVLESIQKYLWPRLCKLDQRTLYELHYHMITFGKVFCTKRQPNCNACPLRGECRHFASAFASARLALPGPEERSIMPSNQCGVAHQDPKEAINPTALPLPQAIQHSTSAQCGLIYQDAQVIINPLQTLHSASSHSCLNYQDTQANIKSLALPQPQENQHLEAKVTNCEPIIEVPASPEPEQTKMSESDIEDLFSDDPDEIPMIKLNMQQFTQTLENYMQSNMELQQSDMSKALVTLTAEVASIPTPKLKNISRLRTEHHVYELPDTHPLLDGMDKREPDDPCSYLLAIWTPGETANSTQPPEQRCSTQEPGQLCDDEACFHCNSQREANCQIVRGTLLIPCRTAMRGSFPLNGTYFQVNEVFADHDSSLNPIAVPRNWLWNLHRRTVYFGTSIPTIFRGLSTEGIQHCFWRGYVCVRGFDQKTRAPRPLMARLHFPASKMTKAKGKPNNQQNTT